MTKPTLAERLRRAVAFAQQDQWRMAGDIYQAHLTVKRLHNQANHHSTAQTFLDGAEHEHTRTAALVEALIGCAEALEPYRSEWNPVASRALAQLEQVLKQMEEK